MLLFILFKSQKRSLLPLLATGFALCSASLLVLCIWKHIRVHAVLRFETMEDQTNLHRNKQPRFSSDTRPDLVTMAAPSPFALELGLCPQGARKPVFTFQQWQELQHQALIYKYMAASLPVPVHLVLPIWKSVAAASSSLYGPHRYPTFMMRSTGRWCTEYRSNIMDAEPGRCRRTDGKKWRCSRDVVPEQKYCERHMHRGRNRSRKPVEPASKPVVIATATPTAISNSSSRSSSSNVSSPKVWFSPNSVLHSRAATRDERP